MAGDNSLIASMAISAFKPTNSISSFSIIGSSPPSLKSSSLSVKRGSFLDLRNAVYCCVCHNASHPSFKRTLVVKCSKFIKDLNETFLKNFFCGIAIFRIAHTYREHFSIIKLEKLLLRSSIIPQAFANQFL